MEDRSPILPRVAIIGGGISGLAAAYYLSRLRPELEIHLFEASGRLGGALDTVASGELLIEQGADSFLTMPPAAKQLCLELGLENQLIPTRQAHRRALIVCRGKLEPTPPGFALMAPQSLRAIWRSSILDLRGKLRLTCEPWIPAPRAIHRDDYDESVASFAARRLGKQASERLVEPLMAGIYVADARRLSLAATQPRFLAGEREHGSLYRYIRRTVRTTSATQATAARYDAFLSLQGGLSSVVDALVERLPAGSVSLNTPVTRVLRRSRQWELSLPDERRELFDGLIVATAAPHAGRMLMDADSPLATLLQTIEHASSVVVCMAVEKKYLDRPLDAFGLVSPAIEGRRIVAVSFASQKLPGRCPDDIALLRVFMGGRLQPELVDWSDDELTETAQIELADLLGLSSSPLTTVVRRWRDAMPQYEVGHLGLVDQIEQQVAKLPGLELVGNAYRGVGIPHCIAYAKQRVDALAEAGSMRRPS